MLLAPVVILIALGVAWHLFSNRVTTDDAQVDCHITSMAPQVPGYVVQLFINDNTVVKEGDVLVQIDPRPYQAEVEQAKANLDIAIAQANSAKLQIGLIRETTTNSTGGATAQKESDAADYASSQAQLEQAATANLKWPKPTWPPGVPPTNVPKATWHAISRCSPPTTFPSFNSMQSTRRPGWRKASWMLLQQRTAAQQAVAIAKANTRSAQARLLRSQSQFLETKAREQQVPITEADYKSALATIERAKATLLQAELNLAYTRITAPISGQVTQRSVDLGQYVSSGQLLFTIVPLNQIYVTANFKETQLANVAPGQRARLHADTFAQDFEGVVDSIAGATGSRQALLPPQNATGNFIKVVQRIPVKILVKPGSDPHLVLRPGMNVEATIYTR